MMPMYWQLQVHGVKSLGIILLSVTVAALKMLKLGLKASSHLAEAFNMVIRMNSMPICNG